MTPRTSSTMLTLVVLLVGTPMAQERPNFAGTWKIDRAASSYTGRGNSPNDESLRLGPTANPLVISQTGKDLSVVEHFIDGENIVVYALDGRTVTAPIVIARLARPSAELKSEWKGSELVSMLSLSVPDEAAPRRYEQTMSLTSDGKLAVRIQLVGTEHARTVVYRK